jgi:hypothetical protein
MRPARRHATCARASPHRCAGLAAAQLAVQHFEFNVSSLHHWNKMDRKPPLSLVELEKEKESWDTTAHWQIQEERCS